MGKHFRSPLYDAFPSKNPFEGLWRHAEKMDECVQALGTTVDAWLKGEDVKGAAEKVSAIEYEADLIKGNVRNHLPGGLRMTVSKPMLLQMLGEQDRILDSVEDAAIWMTMRPAPTSEEIQKQLTRLTVKVMEVGSAYSKAVEQIHLLLESGFVEKERKTEKELIHRVHELEHESDVLNRTLAATLFLPETEAELGPLGVYHCMRLALMIAEVADHAENAADRLRAMIAK